MKLISFFLFALGSASRINDTATGCDSRCSIVFDKDLTCLNKSLNYFTTVLFGGMRNYVSTQLNIAKISSPVDPAQLINNTIGEMSLVNPSNIEDEDSVMSAEDARPIVQALIDNYKSLVAQKTIQYPTTCPTNCKKSANPWTTLCWILFGVFLLLGSLGLATLLLNELKERKYEALIKKELARPSPKVNGMNHN